MTPAQGQAVELAKMVLDKLTEAAKAVDSTAAAVLPHVVRAYAARQIGYTAMGVLLVLASGVALLLMRNMKSFDKDNDSTGALAIRVFFGLLFIAGIVVVMVNLGDMFAVLADPAGAFVLDLIGK